MARAQRIFVSFDNFIGGESGTLTGPNAPANSFTGTNVVPYIDGSIGPRCGLLDVTPSGQSNGLVLGYGTLHTDISGANFFYVQGTKVYDCDLGGVRSAAYTGSIVTPTRPVSIVSLNDDLHHYMAVPGDKIYLINHVAKTVTALTGSPSAEVVCRYGVRLFAALTGGAGATIVYSGSATDDTDVNTWGALSYIQVGDPGSRVRGLYPMRDYLLIVLQSGEIWRLSGTVGVNDVLRRVSGPQKTRYLYQKLQGTVTVDAQFWCVGLVSTAPQNFNGGSLKWLSHLGTENTNLAVPPEVWASGQVATDVLPPQYAACNPSPSSVAFAGSTSRALLRRHDSWSKHSFDQTVVGFAEHGLYGGGIVLTDGGGAASVPKFWWWNTGDDRPPIKGTGVNNYDSVGDASDTAPSCSFSTREWRDDQSRRAHVRSVFVDFTEYATGVAANNNMTLSVTAFDLYSANASSTSATQSYTAAPASSTQAGVRRRIEFSFGDQGLGEGFKINVSALRGIKIHKITAIVDVSEGVLA